MADSQGTPTGHSHHYFCRHQHAGDYTKQTPPWSSLGTQSFVEHYIAKQVKEWVSELELLSNIICSQPHVAYGAYIHGLKGKWHYLARTTSNIRALLQSLEDTFRRRQGVKKFLLKIFRCRY